MAMFGSVRAGLLIGAALFGAGSFSVYPTVVAHLIDHLRKEDVLSGSAGMLMLHGVGSAVGPAIAGWLMAGSATLLPLYFLAMFSACGLYSLWSWYHARDRIVAAAARQVSMAHTVSAEALEMVVDEQKPDEEAGDPGVAR